MTAAAIQTEIDNLTQEARLIQREQSMLIRARRNPARFGQLERRITTIWQRVDTLRASQVAALPVDCICGEYHSGACREDGGVA